MMSETPNDGVLRTGYPRLRKGPKTVTRAICTTSPNLAFIKQCGERGLAQRLSTLIEIRRRRTSPAGMVLGRGEEGFSIRSDNGRPAGFWKACDRWDELWLFAPTRILTLPSSKQTRITPSIRRRIRTPGGMRSSHRRRSTLPLFFASGADHQEVVSDVPLGPQ